MSEKVVVKIKKVHKSSEDTQSKTPVLKEVPIVSEAPTAPEVKPEPFKPKVEKDPHKEAIKQQDKDIKFVSKPYTQFSKKVVFVLLINVIVIEVFAMVLAWYISDGTLAGILVSSVAVECVGGVIWYMKNSEAEKKYRIQQTIEKMKLEANCEIPSTTEDSPDTFYKEDDFTPPPENQGPIG